MFTSDQIGLQLYTLREAMKTDFLGTLAKVAQAGYRGVEFAGYGGLKVAPLRLKLDELGLKTIGSHVPYQRLVEDFPVAAAEIQTLGGQYIVAPSVPKEMFATADDVRYLADSFNTIGERAKQSGLIFAFHNHHAEFSPLPNGNGPTAYDILLNETDPDYVQFELDVFWAEYAGQSARRIIRSFPNRFPLLHIKDMEDRPERADTPVGTGKLSWGPVLEAGELVGGTKWLIVEQDNPKDPLADIEVSYRNLDALLRESVT
jgi:sugar phosphate isomerase/epimerase